MDNVFDKTDMLSLAISLLVGVVIGTERAWHAKEKNSMQRVAGLRTFALTGLFGGICGYIAKYSDVGDISIVMLGLLVVGALSITAYIQSSNSNNDFGITSIVAFFITYLLGVFCVVAEYKLALILSVLVAIVLGFKSMAHSLIVKLNQKELHAILKLLLISVVMLPLLPNTDMGPLNAFNPYKIWMMVVLITSISLVGYFAIRIAGNKNGPVFTGLFGGLIASTIVTLNLSKLEKISKRSNIYAAGILGACGTMFPRILLVVLIINEDLFRVLALPILLMSGITYLGAFLFWYFDKSKQADETNIPLDNPFEIVTALKFTILLVAILFAGKFIQDSMGDSMLYILSIVSGITDVDAITLTISDMSMNGLASKIAIISILLAATTNNIIKSFMSLFVGSKELFIRVFGVLVLATCIGLSSILLL